MCIRDSTNPGPYDELVIKYLYQPIYASSLQEEKAILDSWIRQHTGDPRYAYIRSQSRFDSDPRNSRGGLGDDHLKSFDYMPVSYTHLDVYKRQVSAYLRFFITRRESYLG